MADRDIKYALTQTNTRVTGAPQTTKASMSVRRSGSESIELVEMREGGLTDSLEHEESGGCGCG